MVDILEKDALNQIIALLQQWLESERLKTSFHRWLSNSEIDLVVEKEPFTFLVEFKKNSNLSSISSAIDHLKREKNANGIPMVAVPFMGEAGRTLCKENGFSWMDLSGNAYVKAPGLLINIQGKANKFVRPGRPQNLFAPKSSRITRQLLMFPHRAFTQRELTIDTGLDEGMVSKVVREMENLGFLVREKSGAVKAKDPNFLLDAWREKYSFSKHHIIKGFIAERSSNLLMKNLSEWAESYEIKYAATGLSAAWLLTHFASNRLTTCFFEEKPSYEFLRDLNFVEGERVQNTWLVIPNDLSVFEGSIKTSDINCVHPLQIYLDLKDHPERSKEAAEVIKKELLQWGPNEH